MAVEAFILSVSLSIYNIFKDVCLFIERGVMVILYLNIIVYDKKVIKMGSNIIIA